MNIMDVFIGYLTPTAYNHASSETALQNKVFVYVTFTNAVICVLYS